ncbi:MAG: hypothetical protein FJ150_08490 [Euryarchaeota archaeon]|nr:hypothetical protein [Euryarchaeota archaeon]
MPKVVNAFKSKMPLMLRYIDSIQSILSQGDYDGKDVVIEKTTEIKNGIISGFDSIDSMRVFAEKLSKYIEIFVERYPFKKKEISKDIKNIAFTFMLITSDSRDDELIDAAINMGAYIKGNL